MRAYMGLVLELIEVGRRKPVDPIKSISFILFLWSLLLLPQLFCNTNSNSNRRQTFFLLRKYISFYLVLAKFCCRRFCNTFAKTITIEANINGKNPQICCYFIIEVDLWKQRCTNFDEWQLLICYQAKFYEIFERSFIEDSPNWYTYTYAIYLSMIIKIADT